VMNDIQTYVSRDGAGEVEPAFGYELRQFAEDVEAKAAVDQLAARDRYLAVGLPDIWPERKEMRSAMAVRARPLGTRSMRLVPPSAVWASPDRSLLTGHEAVNSAALDPGRYEPNPKRRIADRTVLLGDDELPVAQLIGATLARVYAEASRRAGGDPRVVLTYP